MQIEQINTEKLKHFEGNPRIISLDELEKLTSKEAVKNEP